ncbi:MAG: signal peptide peptidase SppA [Balneolaceae bacterium]
MNFLKTFLASILGTILGILVLVLILVASLASSSSQPEPYIRSNTVLTINLTGNIPPRISPNPIQELIDPTGGNKLSLQSLQNNLKKAASDDNISGVWVKTNFTTTSWANLQTAYKYLENYKESGKFLYFSTDDLGMNEKSYFLASLADSVFSPPNTNFEFDGFMAQLTFYKDMLDKIGVEPEIFRVGMYKSAVEPYIQDSSSPESRQQLNEILNSASDTFIEAVMARTGKTYREVDDMLNSPPYDRLNFALEEGLIDAYAFEDEVEAIIKQKLDLDEDDDLKTVSFNRYTRVTNESAGLDEVTASDKIAVIYTSGVILPNLPDSPFGNTAGITSHGLKKQLEDATDDDNVKAIVIHIDSPGGAATTSDLLWHYIRQASEKVPVVASMGTVAASGGYYMAMGADTVVAGENTITGSIGIFNLLFNVQELTEEKIGLDYETIKTHEYADLYDLTTPFTPAESRVIQQNVENGYEAFLDRVAEGRGMTRDEVHEVAQGRVYTGTAALEAGLVDIIGDIDRAVEVAAEMAEIEEYKLDTYPKQKDLYTTLFGAADAQLRSWMFGWVPEKIQSDITDIRILMEQPRGQNWMLLPLKFDVN